MLPGLWAPGPEFDEGILLSFPTRVLDGSLPYRDFETFYGPAASGFTAAVFALVGPSLVAERAVGLAFRLLAVFSVLVIARRFGRLPMVACGALVAIQMTAPGIWADNEDQAQALLLLTIALVAEPLWDATLRDLLSARAGLFVVAGGLAGGWSILFRWEFAPIVVVAVVPLLLVQPWRNRGLFAAGLCIGVLPFVPVLVAAGSGRIRENLSDLRATSHDRRLPLPGLMSQPSRILIVTAVALIVLWIVALRLWRADRRSPRGPVLLSLALFGTLQVPFAFSRLDTGHAMSAALVPFTFVPIAVAVLLEGDARRRVIGVVATSVVVLLAVFSVPYGRAGVAANTRIVLGRPHGATVSVHGRSFVLGSREVAADIQPILAEADRLARPGARLFVGPHDLRRAFANDAFVYYLLPRFEPASFYLEVDPPIVREGSRLASDVAGADVLILTTRWDSFDEPNATADYGSSRSNDVVRRLFCPRLVRGTYTLYTRCR